MAPGAVDQVEARHRAIFVFDRENWCSVFGNVDEAEDDLETPDVEAHEHRIYADDGTVFDARSDAGRVLLHATAEQNRDELSDRLELFLDKWGIECDRSDIVAVAKRDLAG
jgi:hypothetical protein